MPDPIRSALARKPWLLADGATGTNFFAMGLEHGDSPELWNLEHPEKVKENYRRFIEAGSDIILTNTFGGTANRLKLHKAEDRVAEINAAAARLARESVAESGREVIVAGSMGPTGDLFEPLGPLSHEDGAAVFAEQARGLAEGGADVLWIETISSLDELRAAVEGAGVADLPVVCTMSFDTNGRTMMGVMPSQLPQFVRELNPVPTAYGGNCGVGAAELVTAILTMAENAAPDDVIVAKSNCGIPEFVDGEIVYSGTLDLMSDYARMVYDAGARIIGGCCGTTPDHVAAMRASLEAHHRGERPAVETVIERLGQISKGAQAMRMGRLGPEAADAGDGGIGRRRGGRSARRRSGAATD